MIVLVFKTDIRNRKLVKTIAPHLEELPGVSRWTVDLWDADKVLRIETNTLSAAVIEKSLGSLGFYCKELPD